MRAVQITRPGGPEVLSLVERPPLEPKAGEVLIRVEAAGVSRADVIQRKGLYPPPPGHSDIPGLEVAGTVERTGASVSQWQPGDRVCALVNGGGYATYAVAPEGQVLPIPQNWSAVEAATLPENYFTVWDNVFTRGGLQPADVLLVHGGSSGIGTTAIMLAKAWGARVAVTAGSARKCAACVELGADVAIDYKTQDFVEEIMIFTGARGADVILDIVGGDYIQRDLEALAFDGRIANIATTGGSQATIDLRLLMQRRGTILGSALRPRTHEQKAAIARSLREHVWPRLPQRRPIHPVVDATFLLGDAAEAHRRMESTEHIGKIVLTAD